MDTATITFPVENVVGNADLSREVERAVKRLPQDRVRCVRVFGNYYRCNWWAPPMPTPPFGWERTGAAGESQSRAIPWGTGSTHHVRQSRFFHATVTGGVLSLVPVER